MLSPTARRCLLHPWRSTSHSTAAPQSNVNDPKASNRGFSAAFATDIPVEAAAGFKAGIQVGKDFDKVMNFLAGVSYDAKDFSLAVKGAVGARSNVKDEGLTLLNPTLLGLYKINAGIG